MMKTPAGYECKFYYEDFHRGRSKQECRLLKATAPPRAWQPSDCSRCPTPQILWSNASPHLSLEARVRPGFLGIGRRIEVSASCSKHERKLKDPHIGCSECAAERPDLLKELLE